MKNLILNHDVCEMIDKILVDRKIMKKGEKFANETVSYTQSFLEDSCLYEEVVLEDEIFYDRKTIKEIFSYKSDSELKEIVDSYK